jgi:gamma-glutamyl hydrolase
LSHVKFLESSGARVVPVFYTDSEEVMQKQLNSINGLYIPGDSSSVMSNKTMAYVKKVRNIINWAQSHNEQEDMHFPILGVGYGYISMIRS